MHRNSIKNKQDCFARVLNLYVTLLTRFYADFIFFALHIYALYILNMDCIFLSEQNISKECVECWKFRFIQILWYRVFVMLWPILPPFLSFGPFLHIERFISLIPHSWQLIANCIFKYFKCTYRYLYLFWFSYMNSISVGVNFQCAHSCFHIFLYCFNIHNMYFLSFFIFQ